MNNPLDKMKAASIEDMEKKMQEASHFAENSLSTISDLIHLNIETAQKSLANSSAAIQEILHAGSVEAWMKNLHTQSEAYKEASSEYSRHLASIVHQAQETMSQSTHDNMEELTHKIHNLLDQMKEHAPQNTNYIESMKAGLENVNATYSTFLHTLHDTFDGYQKSWQQATSMKDEVANKKKPAKKRTSK